MILEATVTISAVLAVLMMVELHIYRKWLSPEEDTQKNV
jgi:hypothetical protein